MQTVTSYIPSGTIRAINGYREYVMVVTPQPLTESLSMSMMTNNANYIQHEQYVIPTAYKGVNVLSTDHALYQTCADWNVFAVEIKPTALADISAFRSGSVTFTFQFQSITPSSKCITYIGVFGIDNELPVTATVGDYYDCEDINYTLVSGDHTYVFTTGMYVYWNGTRWVKDRLVTNVKHTNNIHWR